MTIGVLKVAASPVPSLIRQVPVAAAGLLGEALTPGDRYLLVANDGSGRMSSACKSLSKAASIR
jgi:hypothetical protein